MSGQFFNIGNALESLENAKNLAATQNFQDTIEDIQDEANEKLTLYGSIEKGGGTLLGGIAGVKASLGGLKTLKSKITDLLLDRGKSLEELEFAEPKTGVSKFFDDITSKVDNITDQVTDRVSNVADQVASRGESALQNIGTQVENIGTQAESGVSSASSALENIASQGQTLASNIASQGESTLSNIASQGESTLSNIGTQAETNLSSLLDNSMEGVLNNGRSMMNNMIYNLAGGGNEPDPDPEIEMRDFSTIDDASSVTPQIDETQGDLPSLRSFADDDSVAPQLDDDLFERLKDVNIGPDGKDLPKEDFPSLPEEGDDDYEAPFEGDASAEGIADITTDSTIEGANIPLISGLEGLDDAVATGLDLSGIGAIIGVPLQILGILGAGASLATGIFGSDAASDKETKDTQAAAAAEAIAKAKPADVTGKIAGSISTQAQRVAGGY